MDPILSSLGIAAAEAGAPGAGGPAAMVMQFFPIILIFVIMYFLLIRPQQKKAKEHEQLLSKTKAGDRIVTTGGIYGTVTSVTDRTFMVKIADNVVVELSRAAVATVLDKGK